MKKYLTIALAFVLVAAISVAGTFAYLTSTDEVVNTFTVGDIDIKLDEAKVDDEGKAVTGEKAERVKQNAYHLFPGGTYDKDPTVTVLADSEDCYVRMLVKVSDIEALESAFPGEEYYGADDVFLIQNLISGWDPAVWVYEKFANGTYEFRYNNVIESSESDQTLAPLFTNVIIPGDIGNTEFQYLDEVEITVTGEAMQENGFADADAAWAAFPTT